MRVLGCYPRELAPSIVRTRGQSGLRSLLNSSSILANALPAAVSSAAPPQAAEHAPLPSLNGCAPVQARPPLRAGQGCVAVCHVAMHVCCSTQHDSKVPQAPKQQSVLAEGGEHVWPWDTSGLR